MLYHLLYPLHTAFSFFNVFRYITFRTIYAILTALLISFVIGPWLIKKLKAFQMQQVVREDVPARHLVKNGTPTMGGSLIIASEWQFLLHGTTGFCLVYLRSLP